MSSFGVPKLGNGNLEWEDAAAHSEERGLFAVSDGAASAYRAQLWSYLLAAGFLDLDKVPGSDEVFFAWTSKMADVWQRETAVSDSAPYYVRHAQERGSHATFLGVAVRSDGGFDAIAVGDTCVFQISRGVVASAFPVTDPDAFGYSPDLLGTNGAQVPSVHRLRGRLDPGDVLVAATDATSEWLLRTAAAGDSSAARALTGPIDAAEQAVASAQRTGDLRNDDVAVVRCAWAEAQ